MVSLRSERRKIYTFTMKAISILMIGRTMACRKYDSEKQNLNISI
jgi:hypothetical protein